MKDYNFKKGDIIFSFGDEGREMYIVHEGRVGIYIDYGTETQRVLVELVPGNYFGEMAVIESMPRSATAIAMEDCKVTSIDKDTLNEFIREYPEVAIEIMENLSARLRALTTDFMDACRAIHESMDESQRHKKPGLFERLKKYSDMYVEASSVIDKNTGEKIYVGNSFFGDTYNSMMF